jgi:hypothetical protein
MGQGLCSILCKPITQPHLPTFIAGDFNTHSCLWSLPSTQPSPWAQDVET